MENYYYMYLVYQNFDIEHTVLKWFENGDFQKNKKIDKPTLELTQEDLEILNDFISKGSVVQNKVDIDLPDSTLNI